MTCTFIRQPSFHINHLSQSRRWLSYTGFTVSQIYHQLFLLNMSSVILEIMQLSASYLLAYCSKPKYASQTIFHTYSKSWISFDYMVMDPKSAGWKASSEDIFKPLLLGALWSGSVCLGMSAQKKLKHNKKKSAQIPRCSSIISENEQLHREGPIRLFICSFWSGPLLFVILNCPLIL